MKQLLYIPTGQFFLFFPIPSSNTLSWSIQEYLEFVSNHNVNTSFNETSFEDILNRILAFDYSDPLYRNVGIDYIANPEVSDYLEKSHFELVDV